MRQQLGNGTSADGLRYQDERELPTHNDEDMAPDSDTKRDIPVRILDQFYFCGVDGSVPVPLERVSTLPGHDPLPLCRCHQCLADFGPTPVGGQCV